MTIAEREFSEKFEARAANPVHRGAYYQEDAAEKGMALVQAKHKDTKLYWLVDLTEDRVYSARFFAYGGKVSLGIAETLCSLVEGLTISEACSLKGNEIELGLRDNRDVPSVPETKLPAFEVVDNLLKEIQSEYPSAKSVAEASLLVKNNAENPQTARELSLAEQAWLGLNRDEQIEQVNVVLNEKVRAALNADGGNVEVVDILENKKIIIQYQGACGSCGSSVGATLSFIENALRNQIHKDLVVIPNTHL